MIDVPLSFAWFGKPVTRMIPVDRWQETSNPLLPAWGWLLLFLSLVVLVWILLALQIREVKIAAAHPEKRQPVSPDNLEIIEGIGPKISALLQNAGILTFQQLAEREASELEDILKTAGLHLADAASWPEQASLAAKGDQAGLDELQAKLKGGRRD